VLFDGAGSSDSDGAIVAYAWGFGDGSTGAAVNPAHPYEAAGTYTVSLTVTDTDGLTDTATTTATIADVPPQPPVADPNGPYSSTVGDQVTFDGSGSVDPDGTIASYLWDFSDGSTGAGVNPTHTYLTPGTYTVSLTVTDDDGLTNTATTTATIQGQVVADVSLEKLQASKNLKLGTRAASKTITAVVGADTKVQDATVTLSWKMMPTGLVNIIVSPDPASITQAVTPGKGGARFKYNTDISCNQSATQGTITWTATIDAPENRESSNDEVTAMTNVTCR
jgi:PKD repeat protein